MLLPSRPPATFADDAYRQDAIVPVRVEHRFEYGDACGDDEDGAVRWGHAYNFLFYQFAEGDALAEASYDLDDGDAFLRHVEPSGFEGEFCLRVLVFLSMRAQRVRLFRDGAVVQLEADPALARAVALRRDAHMRAAGAGGCHARGTGVDDEA